jgi:S-formylglutathione hydrolase FrmB
MRRHPPCFPVLLFVLVFVLLFALLFLIPAACAQGRIDCNVLPSRVLSQKIHYCVLLPPTYDLATRAKPRRLYPVLYFLHGLGDNEQTLFKSGGWNTVEDLRHEHRISEFLVVAPEGLASFYIKSADGRTRYSDFFLRELIPYIESRYSIRRQRASRAISGVSMGGYGALRFAFANPDLFSSVSAQSPALVPESPPATARSMPSPDPLGRMLAPVFGNPVDVRHWNQNSPFVLAKQNRGKILATRLAIYFNCGLEDDFGFEKGASALHRQLQSERIPHESHFYSGNHSSEYFRDHLAETMVFHSRNFAAAN